MERQFKEDKLTGRLLKEAGLERPSFNFSSNVMSAINAKQVQVYKPLISVKGWAILASMILFSVIGLYYTNTGSLPIPDINFKISWTFPKIELSRIMSFAICGLLLFLLQIPFLKSLIEREYKA